MSIKERIFTLKSPGFPLKMVYEYNVNPNYLFLGLGDMFFRPERILKTTLPAVPLARISLIASLIVL